MTGIWLPRDSFWIHNESTGNTDVIVDVFGYFE